MVRYKATSSCWIVMMRMRERWWWYIWVWCGCWPSLIDPKRGKIAAFFGTSKEVKAYAHSYYKVSTSHVLVPTKIVKWKAGAMQPPVATTLHTVLFYQNVSFSCMLYIYCVVPPWVQQESFSNTVHLYPKFRNAQTSSIPVAFPCPPYTPDSFA